VIDLAPGQRVDLAERTLTLAVDSPARELLETRTAVMLLALDTSGAASDAFPPINSLTRELRSGAAFAGRHELSVALDEVPAAVQRLALLLFATVGAGFTVKELRSLEARAGGRRLRLDLLNRGESAVLLFDLYRRGGGWRLGANGQGFSGGLAAVERALGVALPKPDLPDLRGPESDAPRPDARYSGSGFGVAPRFVLTNHHVVADGRTITVSSERASSPAEVVFSDPRNDIALLHLARESGGVARFRDPDAPQLGEDVTVLGYPLQGLLGSGPQVSAGNLSALCGIGNDTSLVQFTAPIASGNSGGPLLDAHGLIIGLVCSSLNHERLRMSGGSAENVNFGVKGALVRAFLGAAGVEPALAGPTNRPLSRAEVARDARRFLHRVDVQC
jgi:S1-C subfamily serine protease